MFLDNRTDDVLSDIFFFSLYQRTMICQAFIAQHDVAQIDMSLCDTHCDQDLITFIVHSVTVKRRTQFLKWHCLIKIVFKEGVTVFVKKKKKLPDIKRKCYFQLYPFLFL